MKASHSLKHYGSIGALVAVGLLLSGTTLNAQVKDFLTPDEVDQIRETAQDPNARLTLYVEFAKQRIDRLQQAIQSNKPGRSVIIHDLLDEYSRIVEAIDTVSDDALERKLAIDKGTEAVAAAEKEILATLTKFRDSNPKDIGRYEFALTNAIDSTQDSIEASSEDLGKRSAEVAAKEKKEKQELESMMSPGEVKQKHAREQKEEDQKSKRKAPTLRRPGEPPLDQQQTGR